MVVGFCTRFSVFFVSLIVCSMDVREPSFVLCFHFTTSGNLLKLDPSRRKKPSRTRTALSAGMLCTACTVVKCRLCALCVCLCGGDGVSTAGVCHAVIIDAGVFRFRTWEDTRHSAPERAPIIASRSIKNSNNNTEYHHAGHSCIMSCSGVSGTHTVIACR